ncbi:MAG TPA: hypothetical protein DEP72_01145 [Clostridiales bacterium]|nr:MAG: hypothetical protein A2Y18_01820 [Clostridiales bacterium GWD2_32_19]HCC06759.1 hypothetical protein [Clostridiales bacterium]
MIKRLKIVGIVIGLIFINMIVSHADGIDEIAKNSVGFNNMLKRIDLIEENFTEKQKEVARSNLTRQRMIFQPGGEIALNQMMNLKDDSDSTSGSENNGGGSGGGFSGDLPNFKKMVDDGNPLVDVLSAMQPGAVLNPLTWQRLIDFDTNYNYDESIMKAAKEHEIDPLMIKLIIIKETNGKLDAHSYDGGFGLMQCTNSGFDEARLLTDAEYSIDCGTIILKSKVGIAKNDSGGSTIRNVFVRYNGYGIGPGYNAFEYGDDLARWYSAIRKVDAFTTDIDNVFFGGYPTELSSKTEFTRDDLVKVAKALLDINTSETGGQPVPYFWGGNHGGYYFTERNFDPTWLTQQPIQAGGSTVTPVGAMRPYGIDCSGYVGWIYNQLPDNQRNALPAGFTTGVVSSQAAASTPITVDQLKPGDIGTKSGLHIGMCIGKDTDGTPLFIHAGTGSVPDYDDGTYVNGRVMISRLNVGNYLWEVNGNVQENSAVSFSTFYRVMDFPGD